MSDLALDENGDLDLLGVDFFMVDGIDGLVQRLKIKLRTFRGEWFLNTDFGVPYFREVFKKGASDTSVEDVIKEAIVTTPGVGLLRDFEFDVNAQERELLVNFAVVGANGGAPVPVQVTI